VREPYLLDGLLATPWWEPLGELADAVQRRDRAAVATFHARVARALVAERSADLTQGVAAAVLFGEGSWAAAVADRVDSLGPGDAAGAPTPEGLAAAARADLAALAELVRRPWQEEVESLVGAALPRWSALAEPPPAGAAASAQEALVEALLAGDVEGGWGIVEEAARRLGAGPLARFEAYAWEGGALRGLAAPAAADFDALVGVERPVARLVEHVEGFLADRPALPTLLYGPRGSGKSTAVRALLGRYRERGLRLVELPGADVVALPEVMAALGRRSHHHVLFLDDLAFDDGDAALRPLKSLLDGSLRGTPPRVLVVATSNRRHLVRERFGDRPAAGDDDVHRWDTHHDRLALADRFGLVITFPSADQRAYLTIARALARRAGIERDDLDEEALRFAAWGNGFSGRTARQFVDVLLRGGGTSGGGGEG
jgi:uncharacterized protein